MNPKWASQDSNILLLNQFVNFGQDGFYNLLARNRMFQA